ncbi:PKD domain-containing protein [Desulfobulbus alkaliphilus]|uniref:PKD domain-containing protein n=1 Tax=Desulfobulbus alkaliphilus TaxID=869814 RepID=UPI001966571D|nr:PKD domain-containing protein [Desulfobulbus alkaliphilus]MBM9538467.1 PKD domain-containing protein [Desulfobulbus alkaliphilus]
MKTLTKPACQAFHTAALTGFLSLAFLTSAMASDFSGSLKGVTITDAQETNTPPVAAFTHTISSNTATFNAGSSYDPDGTITEYRWDFGDGAKGSGQTISHEFTSTSNAQVTLTVIDNAGAVAITQETITPVNTCSQLFYDGPSSNTNNYKTAADETSGYGGGSWVGQDRKLCGAQFFINAITGDISSKNFTVKIYSTDKNNNLLQLKGKSEKINGSSFSNRKWTEIIKFSEKITISSGDAIVIAEENNYIDQVNYITLGSNNTEAGDLLQAAWGTDTKNRYIFNRGVLARFYEQKY